MGGAFSELRCPRHLHARVTGDTIEVRCHQCSRAAGRPVFHRWTIVAVAPTVLIRMHDAEDARAA